LDLLEVYFVKTATGLRAFFMKYSCICGGCKQYCCVEKQVISNMFTSAWKHFQTKKESNPLPRKMKFSQLIPRSTLLFSYVDSLHTCNT